MPMVVLDALLLPFDLLVLPAVLPVLSLLSIGGLSGVVDPSWVRLPPVPKRLCSFQMQL